ncbi:MAG: helix-turn-helix domain-containing protein [Candidatus Micrarchaeota archaeon]
MDLDYSRRPSLIDRDTNTVGSEITIINKYTESDLPEFDENDIYSEYTVNLPEEHQGVEGVGEVTTLIDKVYEYINNKGNTSVNELTERLGIRKQQVEKMIEMLETTGLITTKYSVVPNGKVDILVIGKEHVKTVPDVPSIDRTKRLKETIALEMDVLENSLYSMEQGLRMWSSETEELIEKGEDIPERDLGDMNRESINMERSLDGFIGKTNQRIDSMKKILSNIRGHMNGSPKKEKNRKKGFFGLLNLFNF